MSRLALCGLQTARRLTLLSPVLSRSPYRAALCTSYRSNSPGIVRRYATEGPRGIPATSETNQEFTAAEKERNELHKRAQENVESNQFDAAIAIYNTLLSQEDVSRVERRLALFNLGVIYHRKGDTDNGLKYWKDAISIPLTKTEPLLDAEEAELAAAASMNLGAHYVLAKEFERGLMFLEAAAELDPDDGEIRYNLGATLATLGRHEDAIREFEAAEERDIKIAREVIEKLKKGMAENEKAPEKK